MSLIEILSDPQNLVIPNIFVLHQHKPHQHNAFYKRIPNTNHNAHDDCFPKAAKQIMKIRVFLSQNEANLQPMLTTDPTCSMS